MSAVISPGRLSNPLLGDGCFSTPEAAGGGNDAAGSAALAADEPVRDDSLPPLGAWEPPSRVWKNASISGDMEVKRMTVVARAPLPASSTLPYTTPCIS